MTFRLLSLYLLSATTAAFGSETSPLVRLHPIAADSLLESTTTQNAYLRLGRADGVARSSYIFGGVIEAAVSAESNGTTALGMIYPIGESMRLSAEIGTTTFAGKVTSNAEEVIPSQEFETTETKLIAGFGYHHSQWAATVKALYFTDPSQLWNPPKTRSRMRHSPLMFMSHSAVANGESNTKAAIPLRLRKSLSSGQSHGPFIPLSQPRPITCGGSL